MRGLKSLVLLDTAADAWVAPHVGAWIEMISYVHFADNHTSHPTWVRGLKSVGYPDIPDLPVSHPTWVRGLKFRIFVAHIGTLGRTPRGCVD